MANRPAPEIDITPDLVRRLLQNQHSDLAHFDLSLLDRGWDNTNYRLGDDLVVRLPHRTVAAQLLTFEQRWLPVLAPRLPLPIPVPVRIGEPTDFYPWKWSVVPWVAGATAAESTLADPVAEAQRLGAFFRALHTPAPANAPVNIYRGVPLVDRTNAFETHAAMIPTTLANDLRRILGQATTAAAATSVDWLHGDFHAKNVLVADGKFASIIDWGDITSGDRATDLAGAFMLVPDQLDVVAEHAGATEADWQRAKGWAANFAAVYLAQGNDAPVMTAIGNRLAETLLGSS